ncbi:MAG: phage Gp37/Gp68 family protein [Burkholderiales bacterium]|nr:phage Gp37/Gp68 family protein [Burkholderiales bacterium]
MATVTKIEWTERTWNPVTGCSKVSQGCKNCYAERLANRFWGTRAFTEVMVHSDRLDQPRLLRRPTKIFVNSMSDLFHEDVPEEFINRVFEVMTACPQHIFQVLTKRSDRLLSLAAALPWTPNVWMGVSVENSLVTSRIDHLREVPARVRFVSFEPLLGGLPSLNLKGIHWAIVGGESGPYARPMLRTWAHDIRRQCRSAGVSFFMKQGSSANWSDYKDIGTFPATLRVREYPAAVAFA